MNITKTFITLAFVFGAICTSAQTTTYHLPGQHSAQHSDLLAHQENLSDQFNLSVNNYINFDEEEEPELDIYTEGWDSNMVNCYQNMDVPKHAVIDVSKFHMPHPGYITSPYGYRRRFRRMHKGVDLKVNIGDTIRAAFDGRVRLTKFERRGYGYYVVVRHTNDLETVYGHLSRFLVEPGTYVKAGDPIALGGNTGRSTGPHLHFETRYMGYAINPSAIFDFANQTTHTDTYTFDVRTYQNARNFSPQANAEYAQQYRKNNPAKVVASKSNKAANGSKKATRTYRVRKGDTLSKIASSHGVTIASICRLNGIKATSKLRIGQRLKLK